MSASPSSNSNEPPPSESGGPAIEIKNESSSASSASQVSNASLESAEDASSQPIVFEAAPKSAVHSVPTPSVLTADILAITDKAVSGYYSVRTEHINALSKSATNPPAKLFSSSSKEELTRYFAAAVDAEHAIGLRESAILVDIGDCIDLLTSKLKLYDQDQVVRKRADDEIKLIRKESKVRNLDINFYGLEYYRRANHLDESFREEHSEIYHDLEPVLDLKEFSTSLARKFLEDPKALREHRLPRKKS